MKSKSFIYLLIIILFGLINDVDAQEKPVLTVFSNENIFTDSPFQQCHASTLLDLGKDGIMAAWFGGSYEGAKDVCIWSSVKNKGKWSTPKCIVCGIVSDTMRYACWNPVLFRTDKNEIILYYKVGPSPREWWGMSVSSFDNGKTWLKPKKLDGILGPIRNKAIITTKGNWLNPTSTETMERWQVFVERSSDKGKTWKNIPIDTGNAAKVIQPTLLNYSDGRIQALCRSNQNYILESWSYDDGLSWSTLQKTNVPNPNSGIDAVTLKSGLKVLVYNPMQSGKEWVNGRNKLNIAVSKDGKIWTDVYKPEDQAEGEFSYPAIIQSSDGIIHIAYTYNRKYIKYIAFRMK